MSDRIIIIGAGVAGLMSALALAGEGRSVLVLERDPTPPEGGPDAAFADWGRKGVAQFRQSHAFLARLVKLIRERRPALMAELLEVGAKEARFMDMLPDPLKAGYKEAPLDRDLSILISRRATFEWVLRAHVERLAGVEIQSGALASGLDFNQEAGPPSVQGVSAEIGGRSMRLPADLVVDAAGRSSQAPQWLEAAGAKLWEAEEDAGIVYYTRHYRLREGVSEPPRSAGSGAGDLGYLKFGVFNADKGWFSITLAAPEIEVGLRQALMHPEIFERICSSLPDIAVWTDPERSEPQSKVLGMGDLKNRWRSLVGPDGRAAALNLFMVGDGLIRSNPLYGRGCTFAAIEAFALADTLAEVADPGARATRYAATLETELRPFFEDMTRQDRAGMRRARRGLAPQRGAPLRSKILRSLVVDGIGPTLRSDPEVLRAALSAFHMLSPPNDWLRRPRSLLAVARTWATPRRLKAKFYRRKLGPDRASMMQMLGLGG